MARHLGEADLAPDGRAGHRRRCRPRRGLALFDARRLPTSQALRRSTSTAPACARRPGRRLPPLLRGLVRAPEAPPAAPAQLAAQAGGRPRGRARGSCWSWSAARSPPCSAHASAERSTPSGPSRTSASTPSPRSSCATGSAPPPGCGCRRPLVFDYPDPGRARRHLLAEQVRPEARSGGAEAPGRPSSSPRCRRSLGDPDAG